MERINYDDKVALYENPDIADINKVNASDMNNIKSTINGALDGTNPMGSIVVDDISGKNMWIPELYVGETAIQQSSCVVSIDDGVYSFKATASDIFFGNVRTTAGQSYEESRGTLYKVLPNTQYTLTCSNTEFNKNFVTFYDSNKLSISFLQFTNTLTFTTPANCYYVNFRIGKGDATNGTTYTTTIQLEKGSTPTDYTPYINIIKEQNGYVKEDTTFYANDFKCRNLFNKNTIVAGDYRDGNSTIRLSSRQAIYVKAGETYTVSSDINTSTYNYIISVLPNVPPSSSYNETQNTGWISSPSVTLTITTSGYLVISVRKANNGTLTLSDIASANFQLEIGNEATPYTPYKNFDNTTYVLWTNSSPSSAFATGDATLNDSLTNYQFYEVLAKSYSTENVIISSGKIPTSFSGELSRLVVQLSRYRSFTNGTTKLTFSDAQGINTNASGSATTNNNWLVPYMILGYK